MPRDTIVIGPPTLLVQNTIYATPPRAVVMHRNTGTVETSSDGVTFVAVTPDSNGQWLNAAPFLRATGTTTIVTAKAE